MQSYRHPGGWCIIPVHYSADAEKDPLWAFQEKKKYSTESDWNREMEINFASVAGNPAYPHWSATLHVHEVSLLPNIPLCLACDFNVNPMVWLVCQVFRRSIFVLSECVGRGISILDLVTEFRNAYPTHSAELLIYGDAAGHNRTAQTATSDYDLMRLGLQGYPVPMSWKIPRSNPPIKERLAAVNTALRDADGRKWVSVDPSCTWLIADMQEVVLNDDGTTKKISDASHPYSLRTHAADALGYLVHREFPVMNRVPESAPKRPRPTYQRILGEL